MRKRRQAGIDLNFDGLIDVVTNLVGSLILLVVLVIAVTKPKQSGIDELPPRENTAGAEKAMDPLLEEIRSLREQLQTEAAGIRQMEERIPELENEIQELQDESKSNTA